jgi:hypothetical protein
MINEAEAIAIARAAADAEGWAFVEPVATTLRRPWFGGGGRWEIRTNARRLGAIARFVIDASDGRVIEKGYIPR